MIHLVPSSASVVFVVGLFYLLFRSPNPEKDEEGGSFLDNINPE